MTSTGIWQHRTLRVLLAAETMSMLGTQLSAIAMPWLVLKLTGSTADMGMVMAAQIAAIAITGFFGASWIGRIAPRRIMLIGDAVRGPLVASIAVLAYLNALNTGIYMVVVFAIGAFYAPYTASQQSILPAVVGEDERLLSQANAALQSATRLCVLIGPALGGVLVSLLSAPTVLLMDALTFIASATLLKLCLPTSPVHKNTTTPRGSVWRGINVLKRDRLLSSWLGGQALGELAWQGTFALLPVIAIERGGGTSVVSGVLLACFGGGALTGTLLVGPALRLLSTRALAVTGRVALGGAFLALLFPLNVVAIAVVLLVAGMCNGISGAPINAVRVLRIPIEHRGETLTVATAIVLAAGMFGWLLVGVLTQAQGLATVFVGLTLLQLAAAALFVLGVVVDRGRIAS